MKTVQFDIISQMALLYSVVQNTNIT